ncbi:centrosomal protein of 78 kDa [Coccinella septempunctata]|uniref:centrosomal protein of 78 kDa n=1 Tax=Coccinella septempunctata TaxID=41139 RepID=UPI001D063784|nr:centrosomal protein of 78 kDa [Coccinella septempunctata]
MKPETPKSSVMTANTKPNNVFYIWYTELCRRLNSNSAAIIRPINPKCNTVLDFVADRLKLEDWSPLLNALRHDTSLHVINIRSRMSNCQFLHEVDTEDKARRMKRKYGALWTDFILNSLVKALSFSMKKTQVLTCLELDGLPMFSNYLDGLLKALMENRTVKNFSLTNCSIQDAGCRSVCTCLQLLPNVEWLNLSRCDLSSVSGMYIAKLIKFQQLNRYTTSWHKSLRYSEPDSEQMCGIRRITLNANPKLGNEGLSYILNELEDDLWIKALDVQKCGITEEISNKIIDILQYNSSLKIADFRQNEDLHPCTLEKILEILREKETYDNGDNKFQWCNSVLSVSPSTLPSSSRSRVTPSYQRNKTVILPPKRNNITERTINRSKTSIDIVRKGINGYCDKTATKDINRRKLIEVKIMNSKDFDRIDSGCCGDTLKTKEVEVSNSVQRTKNPKTLKTNKINHTTITNSIVKTFGKLQISKDHKDAPTNTPADSPVRKKDVALRPLNGIKINGLKNGYKQPEEEEPAAVLKSASCMFERMVEGAPAVEEKTEDAASLLSPYLNKQEACKLDKSDLSDSQVSLFDFMQDLMEEEEQKPTDPKKFKSKHHYKGKKNGIK